VLRDDTFKSHVEELAQLWNGQTSFASHTVNYTLAGERLDIQLSGTILPGHEASWVTSDLANLPLMNSGVFSSIRIARIRMGPMLPTGRPIWPATSE